LEDDGRRMKVKGVGVASVEVGEGPRKGVN